MWSFLLKLLVQKKENREFSELNITIVILGDVLGGFIAPRARTFEGGGPHCSSWRVVGEGSGGYARVSTDDR